MHSNFQGNRPLTLDYKEVVVSFQIQTENDIKPFL